MSLVALILANMMYFKLLLNFTLAAAWIIIVTFSTNNCLSAADKPNSFSLISPEIGINFSKFEGRSLRNLSNN